MAWFWRAAGDPSGRDAGPNGVRLDEPFESQAAAEAWLTGAYADLVEQGVGAVSLFEEDRLVYGPMSLDEG